MSIFRFNKNLVLWSMLLTSSLAYPYDWDRIQIAPAEADDNYPSQVTVRGYYNYNLDDGKFDDYPATRTMSINKYIQGVVVREIGGDLIKSIRTYYSPGHPNSAEHQKETVRTVSLAAVNTLIKKGAEKQRVRA